MNMNLILSIILLIGAATLLYFGFTASQGVSAQINQTFTGRFSDSTIWYFVFGIGVAIGGLILLAFSIRSRPERIEYLDWPS